MALPRGSAGQVKGAPGVTTRQPWRNIPLTVNGGLSSDGTTVQLSPIDDGQVLANISGSNGAPVGVAVSDLLDHDISSTQGSIIYRNITGWVALGPGTSGNFLETQGAGANPVWAPVTATGTVTTTGSPASGNLTKFSGATSITNGDLSGDVTTSGALVTTLAASGATPATYGDSTHVPQIVVDSKGRITSASSVAITVSANIQTLLDGIGSTQGDILYRSNSNWVVLAPGTNGQALLTQGAGADPQWGVVSGGGLTALQINTYSSTGANTWNKPTGATLVKVILWGGGGGGGGGQGGAATSFLNNGSGGGGGVCSIQEFAASDLGSSETVTIAAGGSGGAGGSATSGSNGSLGGNTTFGAHLTAFGGGNGIGGSGTTRSGGSGGGVGSAGIAGSNTGARGGGPGSPAGANSTVESSGGAGGNAANAAQGGIPAEFGGAGGGSAPGSGTSNNRNGGSSMWGGGGGGGGGWVSSGSTNNTGAGDGGGHGYTSPASATGSGGARGTSGTTPTDGADGAAGAEAWGGSGGGGGGANTSSGGTGGKGGKGGQRGGGGGGGGAAGNASGTNVGGAGGEGGDGYAIVVTYF